MKIAVLTSNPVFIMRTVEALKQRGHEVLLHTDTNQDILATLLWCDVAFVEWCDSFAAKVSKSETPCRKIVRLHSYEAFSNLPRNVMWDAIDTLVLVGQHIRRICNAAHAPQVSQVVIHNGVDCDRFKMPADKPINKRIASVGYVNYKKNPGLLLYCFHAIHRMDHEYTLHIAGQHQDSRIELYMVDYIRRNGLSGAVFFDGWIDDMPAWYADKSFVMSTSYIESFHYSIAEGMACGVLPLIHDWYGAKELYPFGRHRFADPTDCVDKMKAMLAMDVDIMRTENRHWIVDHYGVDERTMDLVELIEGVS